MLASLFLLPLVLAATPQLYLSTVSPPADAPISLTAPQTNAILAHLLDVSSFERFPVSEGNRAWTGALETGDWKGEGAKVVVVLESDYAQDILPAQFVATTPYGLPALPTHSWTALITLHLHRLAAALDLDPRRDIYGLEGFVSSLKQMAGWSAWVGEELGSRIGWKSEDVHITQVKDVLPKTGLLSQVDFLDSSANTLVGELQSLADLVDSIGSSNSNDNGAQGYGAKRIVAIHIKGIKEILAKHPRVSAQYQAASTMLQQTLSATLAALQADSPESTIVLLALPTYSPPIFRKRNVWLKPFSDLSARQVANPASLKKRSGSVTERAPKRTPTPLVPSSFTCFDSAASLNNATDSCNNGNGVAVKGVSALMGGKRESCWVCSCGKTSVGNKKIQWAGQGCEKVDLSSDFTLLFFSALGLFVVLLASVMLLYSVGTVELPGTLASVNGSGAGGKKA